MTAGNGGVPGRRQGPPVAAVVSAMTVVLVVATVGLMAAAVLDSWRTQQELVRLAQRAETRAEAQQEQVSTLLDEFRAQVEKTEESREQFGEVAEAILQALDAQVERLSSEGTSSPRLEEARVVLAVVAESLSPRPRRVVGQAGGAPRPREPPQEARKLPGEADPPPKAQPGPAPDPERKPAPPEPQPKPRPEQRAEPQPPPQSNRPPQAGKPPPQRQPRAQATQPTRPGNADPPGNARGHDRRPRGKAKGRR